MTAENPGHVGALLRPRPPPQQRGQVRDLALGDIDRYTYHEFYDRHDTPTAVRPGLKPLQENRRWVLYGIPERLCGCHLARQGEYTDPPTANAEGTKA